AKPAAPDGDGPVAPSAPSRPQPACLTLRSPNVEARNHRHMVGRPIPPACLAQYVITGEARNEIGRRPDMVEPTPPVGCLPVTRAIAPPGVKLLFVGDVEAHEVDPACGLAHCLEALRLDGRVADHIEQLLVRPDIMFKWCDVEVPHQDRC